MTPSDPPLEIPRPLFSRRQERAAVPPVREEAPGPAPAAPVETFQPRYVNLTKLREHGHGRRNLVAGVVFLGVSLCLLGAALFLAGPRAVLSLVTCLLTFTALFVLARLHVFRQRNGGFLALGVVCLFGAALPLIELGYVQLTQLAARRATAAAPPAAEETDPAPVRLVQAFALLPPDAQAGTRVRVRKDSRVTIEGKSYLIEAGDLFPFGEKKGGEVTIVVRDMFVSLPEDAVEILQTSSAAEKMVLKSGSSQAAAAPPAAVPLEPESPPETPALRTQHAQLEAIRRYPALGVKDSLENQLFVSTYREIKANGGDDFFQNPEWPTELAEMLAKRENWTRGAPPATTSGGPAAADPAPPTDPPLSQ